MRIVHKLKTIQETHTRDPGPGFIEILNKPMEGLEDPKIDEDLEDKVIIIDTTDDDPSNWIGCRMEWRNKTWNIDMVERVKQGQGAYLAVTEICE